MNFTDWLVWGLPLVALIMIVSACRLLIDDARKGIELSMGAESFFGQLWIFAGGLAGGALVSAGSPWWWIIAGIVVFYILSLPVRRLIKVLFLATDLPKPSHQPRGSGFAAMDREAEKHEAEKHEAEKHEPRQSDD